MTAPGRRVHDAARVRSLGRRAEERAREVLEADGWRTLATNVLTRGGEIDLVMQDGRTVVFVEVRQRTRGDFGDAAASLGRAKQARVRRAAASWLARHFLHDAPVRFDAVLLDGPVASGRLTHLRDAF